MIVSATNTKSKPLSARERKAKNRAEKAEKLRLVAIAEAEAMKREMQRTERLDELLAPAVMRSPVLTRDGAMLIGPRVAIVGGRAMRDNPVAALALTSRQKRAATLLQADHRDVGAGVGLGSSNWLRSGSGGSTGVPSGHDILCAQIEVRARLEGALAHCGAFTPALIRVVLDGIPVTVWSGETGKPWDAARAWIGLALDRLASFYWPVQPPVAAEPRVLAFAPPRNAVNAEVSA